MIDFARPKIPAKSLQQLAERWFEEFPVPVIDMNGTRIHNCSEFFSRTFLGLPDPNKTFDGAILGAQDRYGGPRIEDMRDRMRGRNLLHFGLDNPYPTFADLNRHMQAFLKGDGIAKTEVTELARVAKAAGKVLDYLQGSDWVKTTSVFHVGSMEAGDFAGGLTRGDLQYHDLNPMAGHKDRVDMETRGIIYGLRKAQDIVGNISELCQGHSYVAGLRGRTDGGPSHGGIN